MPRFWPATPPFTLRAAALPAFAVLALLAGGGVCEWASTSRATSRARLEQARNSIRQIDTLSGQLTAATVSMQEFLFTGNERALAQYRTFRDNSPDLVRELRQS